MRAAAVALVVMTVSACSSKADSASPSNAAASAPSSPQELPDKPAWLSEPIPLAVHATRVADGGTPVAIYTVVASREAFDVVRVMSGINGRFVIASKDTGARLPWLFGNDTKEVMEKLILQLKPSELDAGETAIALPDASGQLRAVIAGRRAQTSLPLSVSLVVTNDANFIQFAEVLDTLAQNNVGSVTITVLPTRQYADGGETASVGASFTMPSISIGQPTTTGDLDKAIIRRYIKRNIQKFQYCYEKQLLTMPQAAGTMTMNFTIQPDGHVNDARVSAPTYEISACATTVVNDIEFPKPKDEQPVKVSYPITMRPAGG
ncbi:MAG TPA: AgmX/PglI C-terminal domain-containing protein [Kofleriaceae bacterium]|jgi:hypothetical protein